MMKLLVKRRWMLGVGLISAFFGTSVGCGFSSDTEAGEATPYAGIAIAAVAPDYSTSSLYYQALQNGEPIGEPKSLLTGESGDPWLGFMDQRIYFFNRSLTSSNFRTIDPKTVDGSPSAQIRTELVNSGDPHDAIQLDATRILLAHYVTGKLVVINPQDGSVKQDLTAEWDLGTDAAAQLRPEAFYRPVDAEDGLIYVIHQGVSADYSFNGTQQLFIVQDDGAQLSVIDTDPLTPKVQGIKLTIFNPQIIFATDNPQQPIVGGLCSVLAQISPCTSGFERVDLATRTSRMIYDLTTATDKGNGAMVAGTGGKVYAAVVSPNAGGARGQSKIHEIDLGKSTAESIYEIADLEYASFALSYDLTTQRLLIGEAVRETGTGRLTILQTEAKGSVPVTINFPLVPYQIRLVP